MKLDRKQDLNDLYQVCVFEADQKNKMAALTSDWLRHFRLLLIIYKKPLNRTQRNFNDRKQDLNILYQVCVLGLIRKTRWPPWPLIGWGIFHFSSENAEQNSTKLDRKQNLNVLYQVCIFHADQKTRWLPWLLIGLDIFYFSSETAERNSMKHERKQGLNALYHVCIIRADQ